MLSLVFFARVKEQPGCSGLELEWDESLSNFTGLQEHLIELKGEPWREVLTQDNIVRAVNQTVVEEGAALHDGDEVAFFPPVTGG